MDYIIWKIAIGLAGDEQNLKFLKFCLLFKVMVRTKKAKRKQREWKSMAKRQVKDYYFTNFDGMGANEVNKTDSYFYKILGWRRLRHILPLQPRRRKKKPISSEDKARNDRIVLRCLKKYGGLGVYGLRKKDPDFYELMKSMELLAFAYKTHRRYRPWKRVGNRVVVEYCRVKYKDADRSGLLRLDSGLLDQIDERRLFDDTKLSHLKSRTGRGTKFWAKKSDEEVLECVHSDFPDIDRRKIRIEQKNVYGILLKRGLLEHIPPEDKSKNDKIVLRYLRNHGNLDGEELRAEDPDCYELMKSMGLLAFADKDHEHYRPWRRVGDKVVKAYWRVRYKGADHSILLELDGSLFGQIESRGL